MLGIDPPHDGSLLQSHPATRVDRKDPGSEEEKVSVVCRFSPVPCMPKSEGGDTQWLPVEVSRRLPGSLQDDLTMGREVHTAVRIRVVEMDGSVTNIKETITLRFKIAMRKGTSFLKVNGLGSLFGPMNLCVGDIVEIMRKSAGHTKGTNKCELILSIVMKCKVTLPEVDLSEKGKSTIMERAKAIHEKESGDLLMPPPHPEGAETSGYLFSCTLEGFMLSQPVVAHRMHSYIVRCLTGGSMTRELVLLFPIRDRYTETSVVFLTLPHTSRLAYDGLENYVSQNGLRPGDVLDFYATRGKILIGWRKRTTTELGDSFGGSTPIMPLNIPNNDLRIEGYSFLFTLAPQNSFPGVIDGSGDKDLELPQWASVCLAAGRLYNIGSATAHSLANSPGVCLSQVLVAIHDLSTKKTEKHTIEFLQRGRGAAFRGLLEVLPVCSKSSPIALHFYAHPSSKRILIAADHVDNETAPKQDNLHSPVDTSATQAKTKGVAQPEVNAPRVDDERKPDACDESAPVKEALLLNVDSASDQQEAIQVRHLVEPGKDAHTTPSASAKEVSIGDEEIGRTTGNKTSAPDTKYDGSQMTQAVSPNAIERRKDPDVALDAQKAATTAQEEGRKDVTEQDTGLLHASSVPPAVAGSGQETASLALHTSSPPSNDKPSSVAGDIKIAESGPKDEEKAISNHPVMEQTTCSGEVNRTEACEVACVVPAITGEAKTIEERDCGKNTEGTICDAGKGQNIKTTDAVERKWECLQEFHTPIQKSKRQIDNFKQIASLEVTGFTNISPNITEVQKRLYRVLANYCLGVLPQYLTLTEVAFGKSSARITRQVHLGIADDWIFGDFLHGMSLEPGDDLDVHVLSRPARKDNLVIALHADKSLKQMTYLRLFDFRLPRNKTITGETLILISAKALRLLSQGQLHHCETRGIMQVVRMHLRHPKTKDLVHLLLEMHPHSGTCLAKGFHQLVQHCGPDGIFRVAFEKAVNGAVISHLIAEKELKGSASNLMKTIAKKSGLQLEKDVREPSERPQKLRKGLPNSEMAQAAQALIGLQTNPESKEQSALPAQETKHPLGAELSAPPIKSGDLQRWIRIPAMSHLCACTLVASTTSLTDESSGKKKLCLHFEKYAFLRIQKHFVHELQNFARDGRGEVITLTLLPLSLQSGSFERLFDGVDDWACSLGLQEGNSIQVYQDSAGDLVLLPPRNVQNMPDPQLFPPVSAEFFYPVGGEKEANSLQPLMSKTLGDCKGSILFSEKAGRLIGQESAKDRMTALPMQDSSGCVSLLAEHSDGRFSTLTCQTVDNGQLLMQGLDFFVSPDCQQVEYVLDLYRGPHYEVIVAAREL